MRNGTGEANLESRLLLYDFRYNFAYEVCRLLSRAMHTILPLLSLSLSLSHSSFKALEFLVPDSQSKYAFAQLLPCTDASCNPWPKITLENDTQSKRGRRLTFICDTIRNSTLLLLVRSRGSLADLPDGFRSSHV